MRLPADFNRLIFEEGFDELYTVTIEEGGFKILACTPC
jgi:hypothetical protein